MSILDLIIAVILLLGAIRGYQKGFFHEAATLAGLVAGIFIAILAANIFGNITESLFDWNIQVVKVVVFVIVFIIVVALIRLFGTLLTNIFDALLLGFVNRLAGFGIGILKWGLILAVLFLVIDFFDHNKTLISEEMQANSFLYPQLERLYALIVEAIGFNAFRITSFWPVNELCSF